MTPISNNYTDDSVYELAARLSEMAATIREKAIPSNPADVANELRQQFGDAAVAIFTLVMELSMREGKLKECISYDELADLVLEGEAMVLCGEMRIVSIGDTHEALSAEEIAATTSQEWMGS